MNPSNDRTLTPEELEALRQATPPEAVVTGFLQDYKASKSRTTAAFAAALGLIEHETSNQEDEST